MSAFVVVHFHADGGMVCVPGVRSWPNDRRGRQEAERFARSRQCDTGHVCGPDAVWVEFLDTCPKPQGKLFPGKAGEPPSLPVPSRRSAKKKAWYQCMILSIADGTGVLLTGLLLSGMVGVLLLLVKLVVTQVTGGM
ncbi:MAG TPA: hypothetical protein VMT46_12020 [Anaerolineaceae bacterium]|nr:hypothetical protein [Anaerolineaceae bacterium]